ncbi:MAG: zinc finger domain-containing protein [Candidatus Woesearchaeota archaeon]
MEENNLKCSSSNKEITNEQGAVKFPCPNCSKCMIVRTRHSRKIAAKYTCPECGFTGPN